MLFNDRIVGPDVRHEVGFLVHEEVHVPREPGIYFITRLAPVAVQSRIAAVGDRHHGVTVLGVKPGLLDKHLV